MTAVATRLLTDLNRRRGTTIVIVMHDLNLACRYADPVSHTPTVIPIGHHHCGT